MDTLEVYANRPHRQDTDKVVFSLEVVIRVDPWTYAVGVIRRGRQLEFSGRQSVVPPNSCSSTDTKSIRS